MVKYLCRYLCRQDSDKTEEADLVFLREAFFKLPDRVIIPEGARYPTELVVEHGDEDEIMIYPDRTGKEIAWIIIPAKASDIHVNLKDGSLSFQYEGNKYEIFREWQ